MKNKRLKELNILFVAFVVLMAAFKLFYAYDMYKIYIIHNSKEDFIPITAHIYNYSTDRIKDDDGYYETVYNIKYVYSVDKMAYYFKINNMRDLVETKTIYYNPSNPEEYSFYASYEQAREEFNSNNFIGNMFFVLSIVTLLIIIFVCIFAKQDIIDNRKVKYHESIPKDKTYVLDEYGNWQLVDLVKLNKDNKSENKDSQIRHKEIADDNISTNKEIKLDDNITMDTLNKINKEYILDEYGLWVLDENYVDVDTRLNRTVIPIPDKEVVDKIATIPFVRKNNPDDIENIDFTEETETTKNINEINTTEETSATEIMNETETTVTKQDNDIIFKLKENTYG